MSHIGDNIKALREGYGLSQSDLARKVSKTRAAVSQWENGASNPSMKTLSKLADVFGVKLSELTDENVNYSFISDFDDIDKMKDTIDLQDVFVQLDGRRRRFIIMLARTMLRQQKEEAGNDDHPQE